MFIKAYASGGAGGRGTASAGMARGNGYRSMGAYYRATGRSALGATARTRGRVATIRPVRGR